MTTQEEYERHKDSVFQNKVLKKDAGKDLHPESALNILKYQLDRSNLPEDYILFGNVTVAGMYSALDSAGSYIDHSLFMMGELDE